MEKNDGVATYIHTYIHTCMRDSMGIPRTHAVAIHTYMHACMHPYTHTYMHACITVWAYGVLMWELWSACATPYNEIDDNNAVGKHVCVGGRLHRPTTCPVQVYRIMSKCWEHDAKLRCVCVCVYIYIYIYIYVYIYMCVCMYVRMCS